MGSELMLGGGQRPDEGRGWLARPTKVQREIQQRKERDGANLLYEAQKQEFIFALRKRLTEGAIYDVTDIVHEAERLSAGNPYLAQELQKLIDVFHMQTGRDLYNFGNELRF